MFIDEFYQSIKDSGIDPAPGTTIIADNKIHRFSTSGARSKKKDGSYMLAVVGEYFAYGWIRDWYQGIMVPFSSRSKRRLTADERDRFNLEMKAAQAAAALERQRDREDARVKAEQIWSRSRTDAPLTPYEINKGMTERAGMRVFMNNILIVPVLNDDDDIMAVQMIGADGSKKFNANSEKSGYWFRFGPKPKPGDTVYVCEGVSTGESVFKATHTTTYCAFDAGNLLPVCKKLGKKYEIVVCADNDAGRVINGRYENIGLLRAQEASNAVAGKVCAPPDTDAEQPPRSRDFKDLEQEQGIEAVKTAILSLPVKDVSHETILDEEKTSWRDELVRTKNGYLIGNSLINLELHLDNHRDMKGVFSYDEFSLRVIVKKCPPWERASQFQVHDLGNNDLTSFLIWCEYQGLKPGKDSAWDMIVRYAHRNGFHPARDYFNSLEWDGVNRLNDVLRVVYKCTDDDEYLGFVFRKWLVGAVKRVFEPGCKFDNMLIIEGPQNIGKSRSLRKLCTFNGVSYFADNIKDIQNKDTLMTMQGKLILEFAELAAWRTAETNELKAFMTREEDMYRAPYERTISNIPRQCIFAGTTNPTGGYFRDVTGNRRFWPVHCLSIDHDMLDQWLHHIWAEAVHLYKAGEQVWLDDEEYKLATRAQEQRMQDDAWMEDIQGLVDDRNGDQNPFISNGEIYQALGIDKPRKDEYTMKRIQRVMTALGWFESRSQISGKKLRGWKPTR